MLSETIFEQSHKIKVDELDYSPPGKAELGDGERYLSVELKAVDIEKPFSPAEEAIFLAFLDANIGIAVLAAGYQVIEIDNGFGVIDGVGRYERSRYVRAKRINQ